ncbi:hypothetical protein N9937_02025, partial [bacterium]|nr:hypothetical protein [bacterium]
EARKIAKQTGEIQKKLQENEKTRTKHGKVLDDKEYEELDMANQELVDANIVFKPNEGPQTDFLSAPERDVLYGGQAGGELKRPSSLPPA